MICSTGESTITTKGRLMEVRKADQYSSEAPASVSYGHFIDSSCFSFRNRAALCFKMETLYVSRRSVKNSTSHTIARIALIQRIFRQPRDSAMRPLIAGPTAPPRRGASMIRDIPEPLDSDGKMSPMMAGLRTFEATVTPVKKRLKTRSPVVGLDAVSTMPTMNMIFATLKVG